MIVHANARHHIQLGKWFGGGAYAKHPKDTGEELLRRRGLFHQIPRSWLVGQ